MAKTKNKDIINEESLLNKIIDLQLIHTKKQQSILLEGYALKIDRLEKEKEIELENEPLKIFKKKHELWLENLERIDEEIEEAFLDMKFLEKDIFDN